MNCDCISKLEQDLQIEIEKSLYFEGKRFKESILLFADTKNKREDGSVCEEKHKVYIEINYCPFCGHEVHK